MKRLLHLLVDQPELLKEHAHAYAELAVADARAASVAAQNMVLWSAALLCCVATAAVLTGGALMIWATVPEGAIRLPWALVAIPSVPAVAAIVCLRNLMRKAVAPSFANVRQQVAADMQMLREVSLP